MVFAYSKMQSTILNPKSEARNSKFGKVANLRFAQICENPRAAGQIRIPKFEYSKHGFVFGSLEFIIYFEFLKMVEGL
jgi:hypothetical protein